MSLDRREFIQAGSATALALTAGCNYVPQVLLSGRRVPAPPQGPYVSTKSASIDLITHALNRLTFGARPWDYERVSKLGENQEDAFVRFIDEQLDFEKIDDPEGDNILRRFDTLSQPIGELYEYQEKHLARQLTQATVLRAIYTERQLYEVMVQFWTDHFNIDPSKGDCKWLKTGDDREVIRKHALGNFNDMLHASALSPAMLWYLDGRVNRKSKPEDKPNENYARELLELHTLGVNGGYTQKDVMEVARCLTGWTIRETRRSKFGLGTIEFKPYYHDRGAKELLGHTIPAIPDGLRRAEQQKRGESELEQVIEIVGHHPSTARYLATKLCRRFIADEPPAAAIETVAKSFTESKGDICATLRTLFLTDEFRDTRGNKFKRPFNYIVSAIRATNARTDANRQVTDYLVRMGHAPFQYPTPDGYPEEANPWLGTLLWRWNFARALKDHRIKGTRLDAKRCLENFDDGLDGALAFYLGRQPTSEERETITDTDQSLALLLASPEFQMC